MTSIAYGSAVDRAAARGARDGRIEDARVDDAGLAAHVVVSVRGIRGEREVVLAVVAERVLGAERRADDVARVRGREELRAEVHEPERVVLLERGSRRTTA